MFRGTRGTAWGGAQEGRHTAQRFVVILLVIFCLGFSAIWFLFVSRYWSITRIETNELHAIERGEVEAEVDDKGVLILEGLISRLLLLRMYRL